MRLEYEDGAAFMAPKGEPTAGMSDTRSEHPIFDAIERGEAAAVSRLLDCRGSPEPRNAWNANPLIMACWHGHLGIAKLLVERGSDMDAAYDAGNTPLMVAAWHGHRDVVGYLLACGARAETKNRGGDDALAWAAEHGHLGIVELLLSAGAGDANAALVFACESGYRDIVDVLLRSGTSLEYQHGDFALTPLAAAAYKGRCALVEHLLARGADVHAVGDCALGWACGAEQTEAAALLIAHGADVNGRGAEGRTFLQEAVDEGRRGIAELLRAHGASR